MTSAQKDPLIGTRLGDYTIQALLGRGGMARVYRGVDEKLGRAAAVKVLHVQQDEADEVTALFIERFQREARTIANFDHPNIITIFQYGEQKDLFFIAMKLIEGDTLADRLKVARKRGALLPPEQVLHVVEGVCAALDYAHQRGIIHRDVKPSNILLDKEDHVILTDFGLVLELNTDATRGVAFGTPRYISPEQAVASQSAVPQSDIYSLGVIVFEMLTGQVPFDDASAMGIAVYHITTPPPHPRSINPDIAPEIADVVLRALEKEPERRFETAGEFAAALRLAYDTSHPHLAQTVPLSLWEHPDTDKAQATAQEELVARRVAQQAALALPRTRPRRARRRRLRLVLLTLIVLVILAGVFLRLNGSVGDGTPPAASTADTGAANGPSQAPTQPPAGGGTIRLEYNANGFTLYNPGSAPVALDDIALEGEVSGQRVVYPGTRFHGPLPPGQCAHVYLPQGALNLPRYCPNPPHNQTLLADPGQRFWAGTAQGSFRVMAGETILQTCAFEAGSCTVTLPAP